jgi:hypothetical protein
LFPCRLVNDMEGGFNNPIDKFLAYAVSRIELEEKKGSPLKYIQSVFGTHKITYEVDEYGDRFAIIEFTNVIGSVEIEGGTYGKCKGFRVYYHSNNPR